MRADKRFKMARIEKDCTQLELAQAAGVSEGTISKIETGRLVATAGQKRRLAEILGKETYEIF